MVTLGTLPPPPLPPSPFPFPGKCVRGARAFSLFEPLCALPLPLRYLNYAPVISSKKPTTHLWGRNVGNISLPATWLGYLILAMWPPNAFCNDWLPPSPYVDCPLLTQKHQGATYLTFTLKRNALHPFPVPTLKYCIQCADCLLLQNPPLPPSPSAIMLKI